MTARHWMSRGSNTMVDRNTAKAQAAEKAYGSIGSGVGAEIGKLVERVPRFGRLAKAIEGGQTEVSDTQRKFLDDFAAEVGKGAGGGDGRS